MGFQWHLDYQSSFSTPEVLLVRSSEGMGGMSRMQHRIMNDMLLPKTWAQDVPPILINSWEAMYFDVSHENIMALAKQGAEIGCDLMVVDDGWFSSRSDINSSLGDWTVNKSKFPGGMKLLGEELNAMGLKLGVWFEPEMVSEKSELYRNHPDVRSLLLMKIIFY